jgi:uncharacterized protein YjbI with pentapeptide repeats
MNYFRKIILIATMAIAALPLWAMEELPQEICFIIFDQLVEESKEPDAEDLIKLGKLLPVSKQMYFFCDSFGLEQIKNIFGDIGKEKPKGMNGLAFLLVNLNKRLIVSNKKPKKEHKSNGWLRSTNLSNVCIEKVNFARLNLSHIDLFEANLCSVDFSKLNFEQINFEKATLNGVYFCGTTFKCANFKMATLDNVDFSDATLPEADFTGAKLRKVDFTGASLYRAKFCQSSMYNMVSFVKAKFIEADLSSSYLALSGKMKQANFTNANLKGVTVCRFYCSGNKLEYGIKPITMDWLITHGAYLDNDNPPIL